MRRGVLERFSALLLAVSFLGTTAVDAWGFHECPHHDALPPAVHATGAPTAPEPAHAAEGPDKHGAHEHHVRSPDSPASGEACPHGCAPDHAGHDRHGVDGAGHGGGHHDHGPCTCVGTCQAGGSAPPAAVVSTAERPAPAPTVPVGAHPAAFRALLPGPPAFLLPFANAPPRIG